MVQIRGGRGLWLASVKVLLLENIHSNAVATLTQAGFDVEQRAGALDEDELIEALQGVDVLGIRSKTQVTDRVFAACPDLLAVGAFCIGTNQIDLDAATARGVAVFNAPYSNTRSVVELVIAEVIALARRLTDRNASMHAGVWDKSASGSHEVRGRTIGIIGYGNIGSQLSVLAEALGMTVYFYDIDDKLALGNATRCDSLGELLASVETVTLHVDGRPGNAGIFGAEQFAQMRPRSLFLNLSRGFVVDHEALRDALVDGHVAGAAVDVFPNEPKSNDEPFTSPLQGLDNVILTPHVGGSTQEAQEHIGFYVGGKIVDFLSAGNTSMSVNVPLVVTENHPTDRSQLRILHLHRNVPGVLARMNQVLADHDVNIDRQNLATRGETGYVVSDVSGADLDSLTAQLRELPETIRLRTIG